MLRSVTSAALVCALLGVGSMISGTSQSLNGWWHDALQRVLPRASDESPVVLVAADQPADAAVDRVEQAVTQLEHSGAARIGVLADPTAGQAFRQLAMNKPEAEVAWPVRPGSGPASAWQRPPGADPDAPIYALAAAPGPPYRTQALVIETPAGAARTVEAVLADVDGSAGHRYHVDYRGGTAVLPQLSLSRAAAGDLPTEVISGRTALIVGSDPWTRPLYAAPVDGPGLTAGQVHAFALRSLLEGQPLTTVSTPVAGLVLAVAGLLAGALAALGGTRAFPWIVMGALASGAAGVAIVMGVAGVILPGAEIMLALVAPPVVVFYRRERHEDALLARLAGTAAVRARERDLAARSDEGTWQLAARLVAENLNLSRAVFLALDQPGRRVRPVANVGAHAEVFTERRRDVTRPPYTEPEAINVPMSPSRRFFAGNDNEREYIVRLGFGGQTQGYWVFAREGGPDLEKDGTLAAAPVFAERAAELLYLDEEQGGQRARWRRLLAGSADKRLSADLEQSLTATERRLGLFEAVLARIDTCVAVYDAFGRAIHVNGAMTELAKTAAVQPYEATATDLLTDLGGLPRERARALHRQAVIDGLSVSLPLDRDIADKRYTLSIAPLIPEEGVADSLFGTAQARSRRIGGVMITLSDYTSAANLFRLTESLGRFVNTRLRNDLENIQLASDLLVDPRLPDARRTRAADLLKRAIQRADDELDLLDQQFVRDVSVEREDVYPLDPVFVLNQALTAVQSFAGERGVDVQQDLPALPTPALALPQVLYAVFRAALELAIDGASPGAAVTVTYRETQTGIYVVVAAAGYGMPDQRLQLMLDRAQSDEPEMAANLRRGRERLRAWGGDLQAETAVGQGVRIEITLRRAARASELSATPAGGEG